MKSSITPKKSLGQNFLVHPRILDKIVAAAEITGKDAVLEIGPGTGNLTEKLAETLRQDSGQEAGKIIAVEKDRRLIENLKERFKNRNVEIVEGDILKIKPDNLGLTANNYKIVGNIPYYITSNLLRTLFEKWPRPELIVLTIQKEVAQRITAKPPKMNLLAVSVQFFSEPEIIGYISKENFRPRPKVDSALLRIKLRGAQQSKEFTEKFFKIVRAGFSQKRKLLISNLSKKMEIKKEELSEVFNKLRINEKSRAEELTLLTWMKINKNL